MNDLALLAYANPSQVGGIKIGLSAVGSDNCTIYGNNWNGSSWGGWFAVTSCFDKVFAFNTSDGGAYQLFIHRDTDRLYTQRFTGSAWAGVVPQGGTRTWIAVAGANMDEDLPGEHTEYSDDCRTQTQYITDPDTNFTMSSDGINWAEVIYNEARGETPGAQAMVGWTVRNRAYKGLNSPSQCGSYPGAQEGGTLTTTCRSMVLCSDPNYCDDSKRVCCVIHGGQHQWGTSGYQFDDTHISMLELAMANLLAQTVHLGNGRLLDMSNPTWKPSGISGCPEPLACGIAMSGSGGPLCASGQNITGVPPAGGPMEFRSKDYCALAPSCKRYMGDICGNTDSNVPPDGNPIEVPPNSACAQTNPRATNDNFFWNRQP